MAKNHVALVRLARRELRGVAVRVGGRRGDVAAGEAEWRREVE